MTLYGNSISRLVPLAVAAALALPAVTASAKSSPALTQDTAQLKADQAALQSELQQIRADRATLKADKAEGKLAAESADSERVYRDQLALQGDKKDIAADTPGSLQMKTDRAQLKSYEQKLSTDERTLGADAREGRMAAVSKDAKALYEDQLAAKGERKDIEADMARLIADRKS
jgi:hypothetical protein